MLIEPQHVLKPLLNANNGRFFLALGYIRDLKPVTFEKTKTNKKSYFNAIETAQYFIYNLSLLPYRKYIAWSAKNKTQFCLSQLWFLSLLHTVVIDSK